MKKIKVMKLKNLFVTLGASLALGVGALAGSFSSEAKEVKAANEGKTYYVDVRNSLWGSGNISEVKIHLWGGTEGDVWIYNASTGLGTFTYDSVTYVTFSTENHSDATGMQVYCWDTGNDGNMTENIAFSDFTTGQNLITVGSSGSWTVKHPVTLGTLVISNTKTVTKTAVEFDSSGVATGKTWSLGSDVVGGGDTYAIPANPSAVNMCHFVGWYVDSACTVEYSPVVVSDDMTIYGKLVQLTDDSYIYYVSENKNVFNYVHFWGEKQTTDPGIELSTLEVHGVVTFNGLSQNIYKIPVPSSGDIKCAFHDGTWATQTYDISVTPGTAYYCWLKDAETKYSWNANNDAAAALDLIFKIEDARNAVSASGDIKIYSICGISASNAADLWNEYEALGDDAKSMVDNSSTFTYKGDGSDDEGNIYFYDIVRVLREIALKGGQSVNGELSFNEMTESNANVALIIIASTIALTSFAVILIVRKKRHSK